VRGPEFDGLPQPKSVYKEDKWGGSIRWESRRFHVYRGRGISGEVIDPVSITAQGIEGKRSPQMSAGNKCNRHMANLSPPPSSISCLLLPTMSSLLVCWEYLDIPFKDKATCGEWIVVRRPGTVLD
jgi:hypothetical protein